jgi:hypothetical protein
MRDAPMFAVSSINIKDKWEINVTMTIPISIGSTLFQSQSYLIELVSSGNFGPPYVDMTHISLPSELTIYAGEKSYLQLPPYKDPD